MSQKGKVFNGDLLWSRFKKQPSSNHYEKLLAKISMYENSLCSEAEIRQDKSVPFEMAVTEFDQYLKERLHII